MADNKLVFNVEAVGSESTIKKLSELKLVYAQLRKDIAAANKSGDKKLFDELSIASEKLKKQISDTTKELKDQQKALDTAKYPIDSLRSLERQYGVLTKSIRDMTAAQRNSFEGHNIIAKAKELKDEINKQSQAFGDTSKNVGNYEKSILHLIERPLHYLKEAGVAGIVLAISTRLFEMGKNAVEAFGKTEEGAKKLKGVELGFERLKAVGLSFTSTIVSAVLPLVEKYLPYVEKGFIRLLAGLSGFGAGAVALFTNVKNDLIEFGNNIEIAYLKSKKFLGLGDEQKQIEKIKELTNENTLLAKSHVNVSEVASKAYNDQIAKGEAAAAAAKLEVKANKDAERALKDYQNALEKFNKDVASGKIDAIINPFSKLQEQQKAALKAIDDNAKEIRDAAKKAKNKLPINFEADISILKSNVNNDFASKVSDLANKLKEEFLNTKEIFRTPLDLGKDLLDRLKIPNELPQSLIDSAKKLGVEIANLGDLIFLDPTNTSKLDAAQQKGVNKFDELLKKHQEEIDKNLKNIQGKDKKAAKTEKSFSALDGLFGLDADSTNQDKTNIKAVEGALLDTYNIIGDAAIQALDREAQAVEANRNLRISSLNSEYDKKKAFAKGNADLLNKIEQERLVKENEINKQASKKKQEIAIKQAAINSALAATQLLATTLVPFPLSLLLLVPLAASLALQIAQIKSQKFAKGGMTGPGSSYRDETGKRVAGIVHENEYVAPDHQVQRHASLFNWLNQERKQPGIAPPQSIQALSNDRFKKYAEGGFTSPISRTGLNTGNTATNSIVTLSDQQVAHFARQVALHVKAGTKEGIGEGLNDANRLAERKQRLSEKLQA